MVSYLNGNLAHGALMRMNIQTHWENRHAIWIACDRKCKPTATSWTYQCERWCHSAMEQRANIKFCYKLGKSTTETREMLVQVHGRKPWKENVFTNGSNALAKWRNHWGWATFLSAIDKQNPRNDPESAINADTRSAPDTKIDCGGIGHWQGHDAHHRPRWFG